MKELTKGFKEFTKANKRNESALEEFLVLLKNSMTPNNQ